MKEDIVICHVGNESGLAFPECSALPIYCMDKHNPLFFVSFQGLVQSLDLPKSLFKKINIFLADLFGKKKKPVSVILLSAITHSAVTLHSVQGLCIGFRCGWRVGGRVRG